MSASASSVSLTEQQHQAICVPGASVALSAGAGCGKTTVLTERFLAALDDEGGRPLAALVALTFTEKAARELRQRIRARCRAGLDSADSLDRERWWAVLRGLDAAPIGTFHEFCARLIRRHAMLAGVDPEFAILDESIAGSLRDEAVRVAIRKLLATRDLDLIDLGTDHGLAQIREALGRLLTFRAVDLESWSQQDPSEIAARWRALADDRLWPMLLDRAQSLVEPCRCLLRDLVSDHPKIAERRFTLLDALRQLDPGAPPSPSDRLDELVSLLRVQDLPRAPSWPSAEIHASIRDAFKELREHIDNKLKPAMNWSDSGSLVATAEQTLRFARLALAARAEHDRLKRARRGLDFDDLLICARNLLRDHPDLAARAEDGPSPVDFVLVDEFQDTDAIQGEVLRLLGGSGFLSGRLFVVGDVKQSIYRFRGAEPLIFRQWRGEFPEPGRLGLTENFRSVPGVIGFVNALFGDCFVEPDSDHRLRPIRPADTCRPTVEFLWPDFESGEEETEDVRPVKRSVHERRIIDARCIARRLRERLDAGWPILDRATRAVRPAHAGDVALLFRAMTDLWPYESALADEGFDYHTIGGSAFYAQQEVHDVINLLSVVEDPFDEVAMAGALRSPFFGVSDEGLFRLSTSFPDGGLTTGLYRLGEVDRITSTDRARASRAVERLARWRAQKDRQPMARLVSQILEESGFEAAVVCEFLGDRKLANTRKIVRLARDFDRQGGFTLADFVARLRADLEQEPREEQAATTDEAGASVRLMSIHQAKGLEFPIVVLPDLARGSQTPSPLVACRSDLGLIVRPPRVVSDPSEAQPEPETDDPVYRAYRTLEQIEDEQESLRLFYVAATRARDALILSAGLGPNEPVRSSSIAMRLLDERFDRRTGVFRIPRDPDDPGPPPEVFVHLMPPPADRETSAPVDAVSPRMPIIAIADAITRAGFPTATEPTFEAGSSRFVDLAPARELTPRAARIDALVRSVVRDPQWRRPDPPAFYDLATQAGSRQVPAAGPSLIREAVRRLDALDTLSVFQTLRASAQGSSSDFRDDLDFTLTRGDLDRSSGAVYQGSADLAFRDPEGRWNLIVLADARCSPSRQRLRLLFAAEALRPIGLAPIARGWLIRHGPDGTTSEEVVDDLSESERTNSVKG